MKAIPNSLNALKLPTSGSDLLSTVQGDVVALAYTASSVQFYATLEASSKTPPNGAIEIDDLIAARSSTPEGRARMERAKRRARTLLDSTDVQNLTIRELRQASKMSQSELAQRAEMSQAQVARLEGGQGDPRVSTIVRLAKAIGTSPLEMFEAWILNVEETV